jgi:class 3 adenylate cyclase/cold shock CspA family protein
MTEVASTRRKKAGAPGKSIAAWSHHLDVFRSPDFRKNRVVLFIDMNNSAEMKATTTQAHWITTYGLFFDTIFETINELATITDDGEAYPKVKYTGDGIMAVFPYDHEEPGLKPQQLVNPAQVVNSAIKLQEKIKRHNRDNIFDCTCSVGIATGMVIEFPTRNGQDYISEVVDKAARLCSAAPPGGVWIDEKTAQAGGMDLLHADAGSLTGRTVKEYLGKLRTVHLKGFRYPVEYYALFWDVSAGNEGVEESEDTGGVETQVSSSAAGTGGPMPEVGTGTVRRWDTEHGHGFIVNENKEFFYSDRRFSADGRDLEPGDRVFFLIRDPIVAGKNRVAVCAVSFGREYVGRVARVTDKGYGFVHVADSMGNLWSMFLYLGTNDSDITLGDQIRFEVGENDRGPCGKDPTRLEDG